MKLKTIVEKLQDIEDELQREASRVEAGLRTNTAVNVSQLRRLANDAGLCRDALSEAVGVVRSALDCLE